LPDQPGAHKVFQSICRCSRLEADFWGLYPIQRVHLPSGSERSRTSRARFEKLGATFAMEHGSANP
jgi:hypothetical protein